MKRLIFPFLCLNICLSCNKKKFFDGPNFYEDDFEAYTSLDELLLGDDSLWSFTQLTREGNNIGPDTTRAHSGTTSLRFSGTKSDDDGASKTSIAKQNMAFWEGETVRMSAWYYIEGTQSLEWLFLMDLEEQVPIGAGPGMRIALVNNQLRIEHKIYEKDIVQAEGQEIDLPRNQWVELTWEVKLSRKHKGEVRLWQDGQLIINSTGNRTLPKDLLYSQQGTKGMYSSFEIGITANSRESDLVLWLDDVRIERLE